MDKSVVMFLFIKLLIWTLMDDAALVGSKLVSEEAQYTVVIGPFTTSYSLLQ